MGPRKGSPVAWAPQLNVTCGRCGKPRGLTHTCFSSSNRKARVKTSWSFGKCERCHKTITNPLTHNCHPKSDFKKRRAAHEKQQKAAKRKQRAKHDYMTCSDPGCPRPLCVAFKTGYKIGEREGYERGFQEGWNRGFPAGQAACPRAHQ